MGFHRGGCQLNHLVNLRPGRVTEGSGQLTTQDLADQCQGLGRDG